MITIHVPQVAALKTRTINQRTPAAIADLEIWYEASDATTVLMNSFASVTRWKNKTGKGRDATTAAGTIRYVSNGINGRPALLSADLTGYMSWTAFTTGTNHNFYIVARFDETRNNTTDARQYTGLFGSAGVFYSWNHQINDPVAGPGNAAQVAYASNYNTCVLETSSGDDFRDGRAAVYSVERNAGTWRAKWTYSNYETQNLTGADATQPTGLNWIFRNNNFPGPWYIAELLCYTRDLTDAERNTLNNYFRSKYGVEI